ncbi:MAG: glycosyltransferase family 4 protein [candidate division WOR-3 bacterium]|nr:MAG: glycosyltransferase family 4 protein [candidate division WOR-3 bacterium]
MTAAPLRICLVSAAYRPYPSGVGEHVHHLGVELASKGHKPHILTTRYSSPCSEDLKTTRLGRALVLPANRSRFTIPVGSRLAGEVKRFLLEHRFDIVHCHGIFPPEIAFWAARFAPAPVVVTFHTYGLRLPGFVRGGFRLFFPWLPGRISARIAVSRAGREWAEPWFPGQYHIIPNGVDSDAFSPGRRLPEAVSDLVPYVLFVGRLEKRKGLEVLLRAMPGLLRAGTDVNLAVAGSGPLESRCHSLSRELGIDSRVRFLGRVDAGVLPGLYANCSVFASPALGGEAMGIVLVEAMAAGACVVASRIPGYDEVITHDRDGVMVAPGEPRALTDALVGLLSSPAERARLAKAARRRSADFAWPAIADRIERVYREVLA